MAIVHQAMARIAALSEALQPTLAGSTLGAVAERLYKERRSRDEHFPPGLFGEPAWDLLLALFVAREGGSELTVSQACDAAGLAIRPGRTLIARLESLNLIVRRRSPSDGRRHEVCLTDHAVERLSAYLTSLI